MKSATRRKQHSDLLREKILDAARELFVAEGVEAVSMRKIAEKIGYSATTLYNHFEDKEALLFALCDADFGALQEAFQKIGRISDPIERLRKLGHAYITFAMRYPSHYRLMFMTPRVHRDDDACSEAGRDDPDRDAYAFVRATVVEGLAAGAFRDEYRDADLLAQVVWSGVHGVASLHLIMGCDTWVKWRPVEQVARTAVEVMIRGLVRGGQEHEFLSTRGGRGKAFSGARGGRGQR
jgi:AcrR family transcriptional regulator